MNTTLQAREVELRTQLAEKQAAVDAILTKQGITQEDVTNATAIQDEQAKLKSELEGLLGVAQRNENMKQFSTVPELGGARVLGNSSNAGTTYVDSNEKGTTYYNEGHGVLSERQFKAISDETYERAFKTYLAVGGNLNILDQADYKTLREGTDTEGGYLVPTQMLRELIRKAPAPTRVAGRVRRVQASGKELTIPRVVYATDNIYSSGVRCVLAGEAPSSSSVHRVTDQVFGQTRITIGTWMMSQFVTRDLIEDSAFGLVPYLASAFQETNDLLEDNQILNGTGVGANPHGIFKSPGSTDEPAVTLSSTANNIDATQLRQLPYDLPEQYINDNTAWVFNRGSTGKTIAGLAGVSGEFIFRMGEYDNGVGSRHPDTINGYPIVYSAFCADIADGAFVGVFGDLRGYWLAERIGFSIEVLRERYAEENGVVLLGRKRFGGVVAEPFRMRVMKSDNA